MLDHPRLRLLVGTYGRPLAVAMAVLAVLSLVAAGATYAATPSTTVTQQTNPRDVATATSTSAVVTGEDALWPEGTVLQDKPVYLLNATPELTVTATTSVTGTDAAEVTHEWRLRYVAAREGDPFYTENRTLRSVTDTGATVESKATVDVRAVKARLAAIRRQVEGAGTVTAKLVLVVDYRTDPGADQGYANTVERNATLDVDPAAYSLSGSLSFDRSHAETVRTKVRKPRNWTQVYGLALLGLVGLVGAAGIVRQDPDEIDLDVARDELHRRQYDQWISTGSVPLSASYEFVEVGTIEDVVDIGIDTNERVVHDERRQLYAVITENVIYYYSPAGSWMDTVFPQMRVSGGDGGAGGDQPGAGDEAAAEGDATAGGEGDLFDFDDSFGDPDEWPDPDEDG